MTIPNFFVAVTLPSGDVNNDMFVDVVNHIASTSTFLASNVQDPPDASQYTAITNWSSAPITDWPATPSSYQKREALATLSLHCPHVNEDVLIIALEEHNFVVEDATNLLLGVGMIIA